MKFEYDNEISKLQEEYYIKYYKKTLNLPDYKERVSHRFLEEVDESKRLQEIFTYLRLNNFSLQKILIIGLGTGSVLKPLVDMGFSNIYAIEPNSEALKISHLKAKKLLIKVENLTNGIAEDMSFDNDFFDIIFSLSVFEHVQDLEKTFDETIRVLNSNGLAYINCPNYNYPLENHYKIPALTFLGKFITKISALLFRQRFDFIDTLHFTTPFKIDKILKSQKNIVYFRLYRPYSNQEFKGSFLKKLYLLFFIFFEKKLNIMKNQEIVIIKK